MNSSEVSWRKSTRSAGSGECVEVALTSDSVAVRDSKNPAGGELRFTHVEWNTFVAGVKTSEFDANVDG